MHSIAVLFCLAQAAAPQLTGEPLVSDESLAAPAAVDRAEESAVALPPEMLEPIRDEDGDLKSWGIRPEERDAYYFALARARELGDGRLTRAARRLIDARVAQYRALAAGDAEAQQNLAKQSPTARRRAESIARRLDRRPESPFPVFADLFDNASLYHGRPVTLRGSVKQIVRFPAGENPYGLDELYEAWLYTDDAQHHPSVIVCSRIPEGMPLGTDVAIDNVTATGYFFKMYGYEAHDAKRFAPLVLGERLTWQGAPASAFDSMPSGLMFSVLALLAGSVVFAVWRARWSDKKRRTARHAQAVAGAMLPEFPLETPLESSRSREDFGPGELEEDAPST